MKKTIILCAAICFAIISMSLDIYTSSGKEGFTGSPGETTCRTCHGGSPINDPSGSIAITAPTLIGGKYVPGQTYAINVTVAKSGQAVFGFGFEALTSTNANAGTLTITDAATTQIAKATNDRTNVIHKLNGGKTANTHTFTFNWTAPATDVGTVTFYATGNAANGNGQGSGDFIFSTTQTVSGTVGIAAQMAADININLYPNPTHDYLYIKNTANATEKMRVTIIDISGKVMLTEENIISNGVIDVSALSKGNYIARMEKNSGTAVKRFVKN